MALLGELPLSSGELQKMGKVAYASQDPWIINGTIKYNITFGETFDILRYNKVLKACALEKVSVAMLYSVVIDIWYLFVMLIGRI